MEDNGTGLLKRTRGMGLCSGEPQISRMDADDSGAAERPLGGQWDRALEEDAGDGVVFGGTADFADGRR